jgi:hypothetical protein
LCKAALRYDGGPWSRAGHYQAEIDHLGIARSPAYHDGPETNGCVEKFTQTRTSRSAAARTPRLPHPRMARETPRQTAMDDRYVHQPGVPVHRERRTKHLALPAIRATTHANGKVLCLSRLPAWGRARAQRLRFLLPMRHRGQAPDIRRVTARAVALRRARLRRRPTIRTTPSAFIYRSGPRSSPPRCSVYGPASTQRRSEQRSARRAAALPLPSGAAASARGGERARDRAAHARSGRGVGVSPGAIRAGAAPASVGRQRCCRHYRVACDSTLRSPARPLGRTRGSFAQAAARRPPFCVAGRPCGRGAEQKKTALEVEPL